MSETARRRASEGLALALGASMLLLIASFGRWFGHSVEQLQGTSLLRSVVDGPIFGTRLGNQLTGIALAHVLVHLLFGMLCWGLAHLSRLAWPRVTATSRQWVVLWLTAAILAVLLLNAGLYPRTSLGDHLEAFARARLLDQPIYALVGHAFLIAAAATAILAGLQLAQRERRSRSARLRTRGGGVTRRAAWGASAGLALVVAGTAFVRAPEPAAPSASLPADAPHVIVIGLDSLRCDATLASADPLTPAIDAFLQRAVRFSDATTPLARTFPSWVAMLTGQHPHTTGAFVNLLHDDQMKIRDSLPLAMRRVGYRTTYAIDEVRFSNIDERYGFDETVMPPIGAADFIGGLISDAPLSNLVTNTALGALLFPFTRANRAVAHLYDPDVFVDRLERSLDFEAPTFLALHLTLAHWPYLWGSEPFRQGERSDEWLSGHYRPAVKRLDGQFADVMRVLDEKGALANAIVIVVSDHGEAIGLPGDSPWALSGPAEDPYASAFVSGHGTSVLSPNQYRVLFAMRAFGRARLPGESTPRAIATPVSLEDVAPTLAQLLNLRMRTDFDGRSLLPLLTDDAAYADALEHRIRFTETEFNPRGFMPGEQLTASALSDAVRAYEVDVHTGRINIKRTERDNLLQRRQYAAMRGHWLVAALPSRLTAQFRFVAIDLRGGLPMSLGPDPTTPLDPEIALLLEALRERFPDALRASGELSGSMPRS